MEHKLTNLLGKQILVDKDELLFSVGDDAYTFYLILSGAVEVNLNDDKSSNSSKTFTENEFFGYDETQTSQQRNSNATAIKNSSLIEITVTNKPEISNIKSVNQITKVDLEKQLLNTKSIHSNFESVVHDTAQEDYTIVSVGLYRCNLTYAPFIKKYLFRLIDNGIKKIIIDMQQARIIDSTFFGALISAQRLLNERGGKLSLVCNKKVFSSLFHVTRMDKVFSIYEELKSAEIDQEN